MRYGGAANGCGPSSVLPPMPEIRAGCAAALPARAVSGDVINKLCKMLDDDVAGPAAWSILLRTGAPALPGLIEQARTADAPAARARAAEAIGMIGAEIEV